MKTGKVFFSNISKAWIVNELYKPDNGTHPRSAYELNRGKAHLKTLRKSAIHCLMLEIEKS